MVITLYEITKKELQNCNSSYKLLRPQSRTGYHVGNELGMVYISVPLASNVPIGTRTQILSVKSRLLFQLSYRHKNRW